MQLFPKIERVVNSVDTGSIPEERKHLLELLVENLDSKLQASKHPVLNFICTHNSRRSQLAQIWAYGMSRHMGFNIDCHSGGTEVAAFAKPAVESLSGMGFEIDSSPTDNPRYHIKIGPTDTGITCYSKLFDDAVDDGVDFTAVMTCSAADDNCPFIPGASKRISLTYEDPKISDGTADEEKVYKERSLQIATEMRYIFQTLKERS